MDIVADIINQAKDFMLEYGSIVLFIGLFLENAAGLGVFIPGITLLILAGYFVSTGALSPWGLALAGYTATVLGDQVNYYIGKGGVRKLNFVQKNKDKVQDIRRAIERRNKKVMYLFQFPPGGRVLVPMTFGIMNYPYIEWLFLDLIASVLFVLVYGGAGFIVGKFFSQVFDPQTVNLIIQFVLGGIVISWLISVGVEVYRRWKAREAIRSRSHKMHREGTQEIHDEDHSARKQQKIDTWRKRGARKKKHRRHESD